MHLPVFRQVFVYKSKLFTSISEQYLLRLSIFGKYKKQRKFYARTSYQHLQNSDLLLFNCNDWDYKDTEQDYANMERLCKIDY